MIVSGDGIRIKYQYGSWIEWYKQRENKPKHPEKIFCECHFVHFKFHIHWSGIRLESSV